MNEENVIEVSLTLGQWERVLADLKQDIEGYDAEIVNVEIANMDAGPIYALQDSVKAIYNTVAEQCGLPNCDA